MKYLISLFLTLVLYSSQGQDYIINPHPMMDMERVTDIKLSNDTLIDVKFYHLDLEIGIEKKYIKGSVGYIIVSRSNELDSLVFDLDDAFVIDSVSYPAIDFKFEDKKLKIRFANKFGLGEEFKFRIYYHGIPELEGDLKGLVYKKHDGDQPIIASLSTPYLAHKWWPCKDGVTDKADSVFIDITIKDTTVNNIPVIVVSNGVLDTVEVIGDMKTFRWKHKYPIVPYYVMVAISNYKYFKQEFYGEGYSFPIEYYVFESHLAAAKQGVSGLPNAMKFFTSIYGLYPFLNEKYGMTQLGFYGGIENQTNTIINNMGPSWFYTSVHELAHMWFADMITCDSWHHGWLNEGFATYSVALYDEYINGTISYKNFMSSYVYKGSGTIFMENVSNPFNVFRNIIYRKGAYVLHMLRFVMGDEIFFRALKKYATDNRFKYGNASTEDFQLVCETVYGESLDYFFKQWIYDEYYPKYSYNYNQSISDFRLEVILAQIQGAEGRRELFKMPLEILVKFEDGTDTTFRVFNETKYQSFTFDIANNDIVSDVIIDPNEKVLKSIKFNGSLMAESIENKKERISIYPNPNRGLFSIHLPPALIGKSAEISVLDINGRTIYCYKNAYLKQEMTIRDFQSLNPGVYLLWIVVGQDSFKKKVIIVE